MKWFRFYNEVLHDPKVQKLPGELFKTWVNILCIASKYGGEIPVADLSHHLSHRYDRIDREVDKLIHEGLLTYGGGLIIPHNWYGRQYKFVPDAERARNYRARKRRAKVVSMKRHDVTVPEKKESKKEREAVRKRVADLLEARLKAQTQTTNVTSFRTIKPLGKWED